MVFIESPVFTKQVTELLTDDSYAQFQAFLAAHPTAGDVIRETGGLRKLRWALAGSGKRGGVRVIYAYLPAQRQVRLIVVYRKSVKDDLSVLERKALRKLNEDW